MDTRVLTAVSYIEQNISDQITLESISSRVGLSQFHFDRLFRSEVGEPFYAYFKRVRMHNAACRLKWTNQSIYEIAIAYGYSSTAAFTRAFRAFWGFSPTVYRSNDNGSRDIEVAYEQAGEVPPQGAPTIQIRDIESYRCMFRRYFGPFKTIPDSWRDFIARLPEPLRGDDREGALFVGRVYDDPRITPPDEIRYDCCYIFADDRDIRLQLDGVKNNLVTTDAGHYAVIDNTRNPRRRGEIYSYVLDHWMPSTNYQYSDIPALEIFTKCPIRANATHSPRCNMLVPLE